MVACGRRRLDAELFNQLLISMLFMLVVIVARLRLTRSRVFKRAAEREKTTRVCRGRRLTATDGRGAQSQTAAQLFPRKRTRVRKQQSRSYKSDRRKFRGKL